MTPRGIRNNNPGNIRADGDPWQGLASPSSDGEFCIFKGPTWGIRAMARTLIAYQDTHGLNTVRGIIRRWAPPIENATSAYINHICKRLGVSDSDEINVHDYATMRQLVEAITLHENGVQPYSSAQIDKGLVLAGIEPPDKSLQQSRTIKGGQVATLGVAGTAASDMAQQLAPLTDYSDYIKWGFVALTVAGIALTVWARIDDKNKGLR